MGAIFISHSSKDESAAREMKAWLEAQGHTSLFLDCDPEAGIQAGANWEQTLYRQLRQCQAVVAIVTPNWTASRWCFAEFVQAREKGKAIFPVRVAAADVGGVFADIQQIDLTANRQEGYRRLADGLKARGIDPEDAFDWNPTKSPYPGLSPFEETDAAIFFGRRDDTLATIETLDSLRRQQASGIRFALMVGASGSGKSSLLRAGVIPRLKKRPAEWLVVPPFRPQAEPLDQLAMALSAAFSGRQQPRDLRTLSSALHASVAEERADGTTLVEIARDLAISSNRPDAAVLLTIDQAEELFGYTSPQAARQFLRLMRATLELPAARVMTVAALRSDYLGEFQNHPALQDGEYGHHFDYQVIPVAPMPLRNFPVIIREPARLAGLQVDDDLADDMVRDASTRDALPLLAFTLRRLYERYGHDGRLTVTQYRDLGGLEGSIRETAQRVLDGSKAGPDELEALHTAFVPTMIRINGDGAYARRRALLAAMPPASLPLLRRLVEARLLVTDHDEEGETVEVAHEALLRTWPLLAQWLRDDQRQLQIFEGVDRAAQEWDRNGRSRELLVHRSGRLKDAAALLGNPRFSMGASSAQRAYIDACLDDERRRAAAEREEQERRRQDAERIAEEQRRAAAAQNTVASRTRIGLTALAVVVIVAIGAAIVAQRARQQRQRDLFVQLNSPDPRLVVSALAVLTATGDDEAILTRISDDNLKRNEWIGPVAAALDEERAPERREWVRHLRAALSRRMSAARHIQEPPAAAEDERLNRRILIPAASFQMGTTGADASATRTGPPHAVTLSSFRIQQHEVTKAEFARFSSGDGANSPNTPDPTPAVAVTWYDAAAYAAWLGGSLPTEAQWEFAARGKQGRRYPWGDEEPDCSRAHFRRCNRSQVLPVMVGRDRGQTPEGIYDLSGNVWEWCRDWYSEVFSDEKDDPLGPEEAANRVIRGGSFESDSIGLLGVLRSKGLPGRASFNLGFRVAWPAADEPLDAQSFQTMLMDRLTKSDYKGLVALARGSTDAWKHLELPETFLTQVDPVAFTDAPWANNDAEPDALLDVIERGYPLFIRARSLFGGMSFALEETWLRNPSDARIRARASALFDSVRRAFITYQRRVNPKFQEPPARPADDPLNRWIALPAGEFTMGSDADGPDANEYPAHRVRVSAFAMQQHEVTNAEYRRFDPAHELAEGHERDPVADVFWLDAVAYAAWLDASLPTEAQWEYAARGTRQGGTTTTITTQEERTYPWGFEPPSPDRAVYGSTGPEPVGSRPRGRTPEGLDDMAGNVLEWFRDADDDYEPQPVSDPLGPVHRDTSHVLRGGAFDSAEDELRAVDRSGDDSTTERYGFRLVSSRFRN
jgi:formylglycine-generating enzyme required for sulfatase activity